MLVKLFSGQVLPSSDAPSDTKASSLDRRALLVYQGKFSSMDGEVEITAEHLSSLASAHNARCAAMEAAVKMAGGGVDIRSYPPIQLDHSPSAKDTVGRLVGGIELGEHALEDGTKVPALYGTMRILGAENVEKVLDGRWSHVSIGADLETPRFTELSVTPFPAAENARMLSAARKTMDREKIKLAASWSEAMKAAGGNEGIAYIVYGTKERVDRGISIQQAFSSACENENYHGDRADIVAERMKAARALEKLGIKVPDPKGATLSAKHLSKGSEMDKEKLKKHLMDKKQMSAEDADKHLAECDDEKMSALAAEVDEEEKKKLAAEGEDKEKAEKKTEMSARREKIVQLKAGFASDAKTVQLKQTTAKIHVHLAKLRAERKITPAEVKKMDIAKLAAGPKEALDAVLKSYADREPVIIAGTIGTTAGESIAKMRKDASVSALEQETRLQMSSVPKKTRLADEAAGDSFMVPSMPGGEQTDMAALETEYMDVCKMMDEGKIPEAKERMKQWMRKQMGASDVASDVNHSESLAKEVEDLASNVAHMQTRFDELVTLADQLCGDDQ